MINVSICEILSALLLLVPGPGLCIDKRKVITVKSETSYHT